MDLLEFIMELDTSCYLALGITYIVSHNYVEIKIDLYGCLHLEKTLTLHNVIIL